MINELNNQRTSKIIEALLYTPADKQNLVSMFFISVWLWHITTNPNFHGTQPLSWSCLTSVT